MRRWLALGFLGGLASGTPSFNISFPGKIGAGMPQGPALAGIILAGILIFGLILLVGFLACIARFVFLENIIYDRHNILEPARRLARLGGKLFGFYICLLLALGLIAMAGIAGGVAAFFALKGSGAIVGLAMVALIGGIVACIALLIGFWVLVMTIDDLVVPIMYRDDCGPIAAGRHLAALIGSNKSSFALWALMRFLIAGVGGAVTLIAAIACLVVSGALLGILAVPVVAIAQPSIDSGVGIALMVGALIAFALLVLPQMLILSSPVALYKKAFSIYILQQMDGETQMLPLNGRLTVDHIEAPGAELVDPGFSPVVSQESWTEV